MALSARERSVLNAIARQIISEDPRLARDLSEHGRGAVTAERIPSGRGSWPILLIAVCLAVFAVTLLVSGGSGSSTHPAIR
ncbi:DUF3040 domain-containing protein [Nonomuraea sp. NPDC050536]|uniref:DUF3040 domain-containing protein n=1 Tax=Nonomuraea sp. NPDC050536 TaxID=3364366 RepID=UPI0037CB477F